MANGTKVYRAKEGVVVEYDSSFLKLETSWDSFATCDDLPSYLAEAINAARNLGDSKLSKLELDAPIGNQEVWAAGVTYFRSRDARMQEAKSTGGGEFYDRVL